MKVAAEISLFASVAMNAALLAFIAGVLRKVMDDMNASAFKSFVDSLVYHSKKSPFMLTILNAPFVGAISFVYFYGLGDRWIIAGLALWFVAGVVAKILKVPVYKKIAALEESDGVRLSEERMKLNKGNLLQAGLDSVAAILMLLGIVR
ncbi:MAG: hypothetical protein WCA10_02845 [Terracidiphilus sp.]